MAQYIYCDPGHANVHAKGLGQGFYRTAAPQLPLRLCKAHEQSHSQPVCPGFTSSVLARGVPEKDMRELMGESRTLHRPGQPTPKPDLLTISHAERAGESTGVLDGNPQRLGELVRVYGATQVGCAFAFLEYFQHLPRLNLDTGICIQF